MMDKYNKKAKAAKENDGQMTEGETKLAKRGFQAYTRKLGKVQKMAQKYIKAVSDRKATIK